MLRPASREFSQRASSANEGMGKKDVMVDRRDEMNTLDDRVAVVMEQVHSLDGNRCRLREACPLPRSPVAVIMAVLCALTDI